MTYRCLNALLIVAAAVGLAVVGWCSSTSAVELLGYWKFEETSVDAEAVDSSGNGLNGIYNEDVELGVEGAPGFGLGAYFNGMSSEVFLGTGRRDRFGRPDERLHGHGLDEP